MSNSSWVFLRGCCNTLSDIDAALSSVQFETGQSDPSYLIRVHHQFFNALVQNDVWNDDGGKALTDILNRLKSGRLAVLAQLPALHEVVADVELVNKVLNSALIVVGSQTSQKWRLASPDEMQEIRECDLKSIVQSHQQLAVLSVANGHFQLPSGAHTSHFVRLAECLANAGDLDRIVYWIARDIASKYENGEPDSSLLLLVDNPSTLVIAIRISQVFPRAAIRHECIRAYPEAQHGIYELQRWLEAQVGECQRIHCIVSVSSTGILTDGLVRAATELGVGITTSVLYGTTPTLKGVAYCSLDIQNYWHVNSSEPCEKCSSEAVFHIDKARYFLTQRNVQGVPLRVGLFGAQKGFIEKYGHYDRVLRVHWNDPSFGNGVHRAFSVDVTALLAIEEFQDEVERQIRIIVPTPDLVIVGTHPGARALGDFIEKRVGIPTAAHRTLRLDISNPVDQVLAKKLSNCNSLLIVDDVAYTSDRIQSYVKAIRESNGVFDIPDSITLFPLLALPSNGDSFNKAVRGIEADHAGKVLKVQKLYQFLLPDWSTECCPWCFESQRILSQQGAFGEDASDNSDVRGTLLADKETGLAAENWVSLAAGQSAPDFGDGSPLLAKGSNPIQVLFSCASAVQQARNEEQKYRLEPNGFPQSQVVGVPVIEHFQNETLLVIGILRSLLASELQDAAKTYLRTKLLMNASKEGEADHWALQELLIAEMRGLVSRTNQDELGEIYRKAGFGAFLPA
jgi:hypothetical protein